MLSRHCPEVKIIEQISIAYLVQLLDITKSFSQMWGSFFYTAHFKDMTRQLRHFQPVCLSTYFSTLGIHKVVIGLNMVTLQPAKPIIIFCAHNLNP